MSVNKRGRIAVHSTPPMTVLPTNHHPSQGQIATRAHQIFLDRGATHGYDVDDWLQAERELLERGEEAVLVGAGAVS
jgi:Protein of unknown function (DUF2934)